MRTTVAACIPAIPPRRLTMLPQALASVWAQLRTVDAVSVAMDNRREGAPRTRQRALDAVRTEWVAFLDDDDLWKPEHIQRMLWYAGVTQADYVFSWFDTSLTYDPLGHFGKVFDPTNPHHTTMNVMVKTELAQSVGFTPRPEGDIASGEDWRFILGCVAAGANIVHLPEQTWIWRHHHSNTSGREDRW